MLRKMTRNVRKKLAYILTISTIVSGGGYNSLAFGDVEYSDYLDGWKVQCAWSNLTKEYAWDAAVDSTRQPKLVATYRIDNAAKDYPAGSLRFTIPGIGGADRAKIIKASQLAADKADSEWEYTWDPLSDTYTFTNQFSVDAGQSVSGGFEMLWTMNARESTDGYFQEESPLFTVADAGTITLEPLSYDFTSERDRYRIEMFNSKLSMDEYDTADKDYIWYDLETVFDKDWLARGLYKSDYYVTIELPDGESYEDVTVKHGGREVELTEDENGDYGFYPFKEKYGDLGSRYSDYTDTFTVGFLKETLTDDTVTVRGHLDRLYNDESEWVTTAGELEDVDCEKTFTVEDYHFDYNGYIYRTDKWNNQYEYS